MALLPERLPAALSDRLASAAQSIYSRQGREVDIAIGGIPFVLANTAQTPKIVETIAVRKDQLDTEQDPGEQSLTSWWRRSQSSFHEGAGSLYAEDNSGNASNGYCDSEGVYPFEQGQITLLRRMDQTSAPGDVYSRARVVSPTTSSFVKNGTFSTGAAIHAPASKTVVDGMVSGNFFYDITADGNLYYGNAATGVSSATWPLGAGVSATRIGWGKHRLWVIGGPSIWQPDPAAATGTTQSAKYTHPSPGWTYTCMADSPTAMLFGGHDGLSSTIQGISLDSSSGVPVTGGAVTVATLPDGELVQEIAVLAGTFVGIGTSQGFRVGVLDSSGFVTYGPLIITPVGMTACTAITTQDRFFVVAFATPDNRALAYRVDTSVDLNNGVFAYAKDIDCGAVGSITSLAPSGSLVATTSNGAAWAQSTDHYVSKGFLQTGRIRYRTTELKSFQLLSLEMEPLNGTVAASILPEGGGSLALGTASTQGETFSDSYAIQLSPRRYAAVRLDLASGAGATTTPVVNSYLLRALPAVAPQRMITLPLLCMNQERTKSGQTYGSDTYAMDRLTALQLLEDAAEPIVYQDFSLPGASGQLVTIESIRFVQNTPPSPTNNGNTGGILTIQLRTVA